MRPVSREAHHANAAAPRRRGDSHNRIVEVHAPIVAVGLGHDQRANTELFPGPKVEALGQAQCRFRYLPNNCAWPSPQTLDTLSAATRSRVVPDGATVAESSEHIDSARGSRL